MRNNSLYIIYFVLLSVVSHINAQIDVVCIGNSITWGSKLPDPASESYPSRLAVLLGNNYTVKNRGEPGTTLLKNTTNTKPYIGSQQWVYSIATSHEIVIILLGTNDSIEENWFEKDHFKEDYLELINDYKNYPGHDDPIFILGLPPPVFNESDGHRNAPILDEMIPMIKQIANETDATIADFYHAFDGKPELFIDGVHPDAVGDALMAEVAYDAVQKALVTSDIPYNPPDDPDDPYIPYNPPPNTPTGLKTISGINNIDLEWHSNTEDDLWSYRIYRSYSDGGFQDLIGEKLIPDTTYTDNNIEIDHIYYYAIDATDNHSNASSRTAAIAGKTIDITPPQAPLNLQASLEADSVKLSWTPNGEPDLEKYYIYRSTLLNNIQNSLVGTVHAPDSTFNDIGYNSAKNYYYGVTAEDLSGNQGLISNIVNITTNSRPLCSDTTLILYEDVPHQFQISDFPFTDADNHTLDKIIFIDSDSLNYFTYDNDTLDTPLVCDDISKLLFTMNLDEFGENYAEFTFRVVDSFGSASLGTNIATINVAPVNDAPHIDPISDLYIIEDSHNLLLPVTGINAGPANELQNLSVIAFADLVNFDNTQYNSPEETGLVIINPVDNAFGIIPVTIQIVDDGGTINGGVDTFSTIFNLHISPINDPPIFNFFDNIEIQEDLETTIEITGIQPGPWEINQQINMSVYSNDTDMLPHPELNYSSPDTFATLTFSTIPNIFGTTSITINMSDDNGTDFGGEDSASYTIPVEVISVNDKPFDFNIITPTNDSTLVINKSNFLNTFSISWEASSDIENDDIIYDIIFSEDLSALSRYGLNATNIQYVLKDILTVTDTVSIANGTYSIIASDGDLQTDARNSGFSLTVDGRSFAPAKLHLDQNYPNPFNQSTLIGFDLPKRANVSIIIYDLLGKEIIKLINNKKYDRGYSTITWNGIDKENNIVTAGIYLMQIRMENEIQHKKLIFLK